EVHNPSLGTGTPTITGYFGSASMASFFTRETYNYDDRYYATYTYRYDGSSNFGPKNRWAGFHSMAASWRFSNEKWLREATWLSNGKLRFGWGQTGNANIGGYRWGVALATMASGLGQSYRPAGLANESIKWETQTQFDLGLDLGFLNNRLQLTLDWYRKESKDMLMRMQLPSYLGTQGNGSSALSAPWGNFGTMRNTGYEIQLRAMPVQKKNFSWETDLQFSFNQNKLVALQGTSNAAIIGYGQWTDVVAMSNVGGSMYNFYGYEVEGVYKDWNDIMNSPINLLYGNVGMEFAKDANGKETDQVIGYSRDITKYSKRNSVWPGDLKFKDVNGDGKIDENDKTNIGSPLPKCTFGFTNTFRWKNFDLNIFINGSIGNKVMNYTAINLTSMSNTWFNQINGDIADRAQLAPIDPTVSYEGNEKIHNWYDDISNVYVVNADTKTPRVAEGNSYNSNISSRYIEDGSYVRLKNIALGYTFPKKRLQKANIDNLRIYANIQNLYTLTGYKGYDPEIGASTTDANGYVFGLDNGRYPSPTTFSLGLNLTLGGGRVKKAADNSAYNGEPVVVEKVVEKIVEKPVEKIVVKEVVKEVPAQKTAVSGDQTLDFVIGQTDLRPGEAFKLGQICEMLRENPDTKVVVHGSADSATGSEAVNKRLSAARAQNVKDMLVKAGIDASRITTTSGIGADRVAICVVK
ncbi:MAG: SusC/RagA family TonB-linked outer membrane protein, partial [Bacteroidaceae bacterium]|nr:SusC/RagA family TonB-linked outer membrane protein [Bacteroidaceae bacterium]